MGSTCCDEVKEGRLGRPKVRKDLGKEGLTGPSDVVES